MGRRAEEAARGRRRPPARRPSIPPAPHSHARACRMCAHRGAAGVLSTILGKRAGGIPHALTTNIARTRGHGRMRARTRAHARTHTRTSTRTHAHAHAHAQARVDDDDASGPGLPQHECREPGPPLSRCRATKGFDYRRSQCSFRVTGISAHLL